ncbi:hypothetical protein A2Z33_06370 [Candidatus Gottesmanbacteria bacterium RBG_16_52_11]|uniref:Uncharacterized protein n=1 Tax=Candidatus Gottesmanbacteria bacterium RBG_16_52_11 TaxID=1798374 RepID=A0A1F5YXN4_9BACT|nr:MAG: hypothetical protein A2Z33_06370 [Candidatus Gottesmanbacteria bacterium RBG_16_52_11]
MKLSDRTTGWVRKHRVAAILIAVIITTGIVFTVRSRTGRPSVQVTTQAAEPGTVVSSVTASGSILTSNLVNVSTSVNGIIREVYVHDGDSVVAGQKIMEITPDTASAQNSQAAYASYLSAKSSLDAAKVSLYTLQSDMLTKWQEFRELAESDSYENPDGSPKSTERTLPQFMTVQDDWLAAEATYKNQQGKIAQAQAALSGAWLAFQAASTVVTAPMSGTVTNITYTPGMTIAGSGSSGTGTSTTTSTNRVAVITSAGLPLASFTVSEIDVPDIKPGQKVTLTLDAVSGKSFTGKVMTVDRIGSVSSGVTTYPVVVSFDTTAEDILPNMAATANIILDSKTDVLKIPSSAISGEGDQKTVRVKKGNNISTVSVVTGLSSDTDTEIIEGLSEGDEVVVSTQTSGQSQSGSSVFGGFGGGGFIRTGGFSGSQRR